MVPLDLNVRDVTSTDPMVAKVGGLSANVAVHVSRRPNIRFAGQASTVVSKVADWTPTGVGHATLVAEVVVHNQQSALLAFVRPEDDVKATP